MSEIPDQVKNYIAQKENQTFEIKSIKTEARDLCNEIIAFANAEGGCLVIGMTNDRQLEGFRGFPNKENELIQMFDTWIKPPVDFFVSKIPFQNREQEDFLMVVDVRASERVHENAKNESYVRSGDQTRELKYEERQHLAYLKGEQNFESEEVRGATLEDLDTKLIEQYCSILGTDLSTTKDVLVGKNLISSKDQKEVVTKAAILLFGNNPQKWFDLARVRVIKYDGVEEKTGKNINHIKDEIFEGAILSQLEKTKLMIKSQLKDFTDLDTETGKFIVKPEYPEFAWLEAIINALVHREYAIKGMDIQVKIFDDRVEIVSPGELPYLVRVDNIKDTRYSRNPKIARVMLELGYIRELGEGVNRMFDEMKAANLPEPLFYNGEGYLKVTLYNDLAKRKLLDRQLILAKKMESKYTRDIDEREETILAYMLNNTNRLQTSEALNLFDLSRQRVIEILREMISKNLIRKVGEKGPGVYYELTERVLRKKDSKNLSTYPQEEKRDNSEENIQKRLFD